MTSAFGQFRRARSATFSTASKPNAPGSRSMAARYVADPLEGPFRHRRIRHARRKPLVGRTSDSFEHSIGIPAQP